MEQSFWQNNGNKNCQVAFGTLKSARPKFGVLPKGRNNPAFAGSPGNPPMKSGGHQLQILFERRDKNKYIERR